MKQYALRAISIFRVLGQDMIRCDLPKQASAMAYVTLLSIVPSLAALICLMSLFSPALGESNQIVEILKGYIVENLTASAGDQVTEYLNTFLANLNLAKIGWSSFAVILFSLILLLRQIEVALNRVWLVRKGRNVFTRFVYFWTFLSLGIFILSMSIGLSTGFNIDTWVQNIQTGVGVNSVVMSILRGWFSGFVFFFFLYKIVPNCKVGAKDAAIGAAISALLFQLAAHNYAIYAKDFSSYKSVYGALAALPLFLIWLYICWLIILLGSVVSWRMQRGFPQQQEEDTVDAATSPCEQFRNHQIQAMLPVFSLLTVYKHFLAGTGKGISDNDLASSLKLPISWVRESLDTIADMGYIIVTESDDVIPDGKTPDVMYFPTFPAKTLMLDKLVDDFSQQMSEWAGNWDHEVPIDFSKTIDFLFNSDKSEFPKLSLEDVLVM